MRFELTVALKYLVPRWKQLSVSIISLISILVISLVVWLVVLFLSVTEGIEKKWVDELVALNAPVRMAPTEAYYRSYYHQIDSLSYDSNYTSKTIGEKLAASSTDPYDPSFDMELLYDFPPPDRHPDGRLKDPVKEGYEAVRSLQYKGISPREYEVNFGNLRLQLLREGHSSEDLQQTFLTQVSYIASHDQQNRRVAAMISPLEAADYNNLLFTLAQINTPAEEEMYEPLHFPLDSTPDQFRSNLKSFFENIQLDALITKEEGFELTPALFPLDGNLEGVGLVRYGQIYKVFLPQSTQELPSLNERLAAYGYTTTPIHLLFEEEQMHLSSEEGYLTSQGMQILLDQAISFKPQLVEKSLNTAGSLDEIRFKIEGKVQNVPISGETYYKHLEIGAVTPKQNSTDDTLWIQPCTSKDSTVPCDQILGDGILVAKHFKNSDVRLGDRGYLSYYSQAGSSMQEQRVPVYVAGFYDPGVMPIGNKLLFVDPKVSALLRGNMTVADQMLGNGINIWLENLNDASLVKEELIKSLEARGIGQYWSVQSYHDYEFTRPILEQLHSDKNLFTLIAVIILLVACSNIISMLILLVNDKKKEIGILQSMGASPRSIATIFGLCGFVTGVISCILGTAAAILTLKNLQSLVSLLSFFQGRDAFQAAFYGSSLPNDLSYSALIFVLVATLVISLLAGIIPAVKASRIRPTEILKSE